MSDILDSIDDLIDSDSEDFELEGIVIEDDDLELDEIASPEMDENEARDITEAIRGAATATYILLAQAHEGKAYKALGYGTWAEYVKDQFEISTARSYQLLDLSKAVKMIEEAAPEGTLVRLTEAQARGIKKELPNITEQIKEATTGKSPSEASEMVNELLETAHEQKKADDKAIKEKDQRAEEAAEDGYRAGLEAATDAFLDEADEKEEQLDDRDRGPSGDGANITAQDSMDIYNFLSVLTGVTSLPDPKTLIRIIPQERATEIGDQIDEVVKWFNSFKESWNNQD